MPQFFQNSSRVISTLIYRFGAPVKKNIYINGVSPVEHGRTFLCPRALGTDLGTWGGFPGALVALKAPLFLHRDPLC